jgi:hypothetical protein
MALCWQLSPRRRTRPCGATALASLQKQNFFLRRGFASQAHDVRVDAFGPERGDEVFPLTSAAQLCIARSMLAAGTLAAYTRGGAT